MHPTGRQFGWRSRTRLAFIFSTSGLACAPIGFGSRSAASRLFNLDSQLAGTQLPRLPWFHMQQLNSRARAIAPSPILCLGPPPAAQSAGTAAHTCANSRATAASRQSNGCMRRLQRRNPCQRLHRMVSAVNRNSSTGRQVQRPNALQQRQQGSGSPPAGASPWQRFAFFVEQGNPKEAWLSIRCASHRQLQPQLRQAHDPPCRSTDAVRRCCS